MPIVQIYFGSKLYFEENLILLLGLIPLAQNKSKIILDKSFVPKTLIPTTISLNSGRGTHGGEE